MIGRCIYVWKLAPVIAAEGGVDKMVEKAKRAKLSAIWVKIADGTTPHANVTSTTATKLKQLINTAKSNGVEIWGWQVPHCATIAAAAAEAKVALDITKRLGLPGLIMDAEGGSDFFHGGLPEAIAYADAMRAGCDALGIPLAISSNDIPQNITNWLPRFTAIAQRAHYNFPQTYYGSSPSVVHRVDRAVTANAHIAAPFVPVGAAWIGDGGGCSSASACAERAREFIRLCGERNYQGYSFWHWGGAPLAFWEVLNTVPA